MSLLSDIRMVGRGLVLVAGLALSFLCGAQTLRDPTQSPAAAQSAADAGRQTPATLNPGQWAILVRNGVPYLVHDARLYATGQRVGAARIERLTETEVWLREAGVLSKIRVFQGIERRATVPVPAASQRLTRP